MIQESTFFELADRFAQCAVYKTPKLSDTGAFSPKMREIPGNGFNLLFSQM